MNPAVEIAKDAFVVLEYTLRLEDGSYLKGENEPASLNFVVGYDQLLPGLERRLLGLNQGQQVDIVVPAREAFGEYDPALVKEKSFDEHPPARDFEVGKWIMASNEDYKVSYTYFVKAKTDAAAILDYNHPLAGKDLYYHIDIVHVREASLDELEQLRPCEFQKQPGAAEA